MNSLKILPLGGLGEIGMNCMIFEYGHEIILIDCGLIFSDLEHFGVEFVIPDFSYLKGKEHQVQAIFITHGHEDHIGALPFALKAGILAPIYASVFSSLLIREKLKEYGLEGRVPVKVFQMGERIELKNFQVVTLPVNHSIVDSAALVIHTPLGTVLHTGDFKIDPTPFLGHCLDSKEFQRLGDEGVLLLLSDSTNIERTEHSLSESVIYEKFEQLFESAQGLTLVSLFASNVSRIGQVFDLAKKMGKKVALTGRSMEQNVRLGLESSYLNSIESCWIPLDKMNHYARNQLIVLSTGSQGEYRSALIRIAMGEHPQVKLQPGDLVLMSSKFIPGNEKAIGRMINDLFKQGAEVLYEAVHDIHVSGHATYPELRQMLEWVRPKFFIPIHGEYRHLVRHADLAKKTGVPHDHVLIAVNGDRIELTAESCHVVDHHEMIRVLIEGRQGNDISKLVLRERRQMGEKGIVFSLLVRHVETRKIIAGPEIIAKGFLASTESPLLEEAKKRVRRIVLQYQKINPNEEEIDLQEEIRIELRRFFRQVTGKKPIVLPLVLDL